MRYLLIPLAFIAGGCSLFEPKYIYVYPTYTKIVAIDKIPQKKVQVREDGTLGPQSTTTVLLTTRALRIKENYTDNQIKKHNELADKKNKLALKNKEK